MKGRLLDLSKPGVRNEIRTGMMFQVGSLFGTFKSQAYKQDGCIWFRHKDMTVPLIFVDTLIFLDQLK